MDGMSDRVLVDIADGVATVRLNRPDKRNALDGEMFQAIADAGEQLKSASDVRAVVLSGEGKSFCAGLDLAMFGGLDHDAEPGNPGTLQPSGVTHLGQQVAWVWQELPVPVIVAVHGHALGGGLQIALGADIRIVHPDAQLSVREVHWGLVPDMTGTFFLSKLVGADVAKELTFTARIFDGREAAVLGLATRLSDDPLPDALALAAEIAGRSPDAVRAAKRLFNRLANDNAAEQFAEERREIAAIIEGGGAASRP
jgi:enoyl-CoA hydratase/carnithine racemase